MGRPSRGGSGPGCRPAWGKAREEREGIPGRASGAGPPRAEKCCAPAGRHLVVAVPLPIPGSARDASARTGQLLGGRRDPPAPAGGPDRHPHQPRSSGPAAAGAAAAAQRVHPQAGCLRGALLRHQDRPDGRLLLAALDVHAAARPGRSPGSARGADPAGEVDSYPVRPGAQPQGDCRRAQHLGEDRRDASQQFGQEAGASQPLADYGLCSQASSGFGRKLRSVHTYCMQSNPGRSLLDGPPFQK